MLEVERNAETSENGYGYEKRAGNIQPKDREGGRQIAFVTTMRTGTYGLGIIDGGKGRRQIGVVTTERGRKDVQPRKVGRERLITVAQYKLRHTN